MAQSVQQRWYRKAALLLACTGTALLAAGPVGASPGNALTLYDASADGGGSDAAGTIESQSFTTGADPVAVTSVSTVIRDAATCNCYASPTTYGLAIAVDAGGQPGATVGVVTSAQTDGPWSNQTDAFPLTTPISLAPDTTYDLVMTIGAGTLIWKTGAPLTTGVTPMPTFTAQQSADSGATWSVLTGTHFNMAVSGMTVVATQAGAFTPTSGVVGTTATLVAPTATTPGSWSYVSSDPTVASVSGSTIDYVAAGSATISAIFTPTSPLVDSGATATTTATSLVPSAPGPPTAVVATAGDGTATVAWTGPASVGTGPLTGYTASSEPPSAGCTATPPTTSCQVTGLIDGTSYSFAVRAENAVGPGPVSASSITVTPTAVPVVPTSATPAPPAPPATPAVPAAAPTAPPRLPIPAPPAGPSPAPPLGLTAASAASAAASTTGGAPPGLGLVPASPTEPNAHPRSMAPTIEAWPMAVTAHLATSNVFGDAEGDQLVVQADLSAGSKVAGSVVQLSGVGLEPGSIVQVSVHSSPTILLTQRVGSTGRFSGTTRLPPGLTPGDHVLLTTGTANGQGIAVVGTFAVDGDGTATHVAQPAVLDGYTGPADPRLVRALRYDLPVYDPAAHPMTTMGLAVVGVSFLALAGAAGIGALGVHAGRPESLTEQSERPRSSGHRSHKSGSLGSAATKKLKRVDLDRDAWGDRSPTWRLPGTDRADRFSASAPIAAGRWSALAPRVIGDGVWARAVFGSGGFALWLLGLLVGVTAGLAGGGSVVPSFAFIVAMVVLGILDAGSGALAWIGWTGIAVASGSIRSWPDVLLLLGMAVLSVAVSLLCHVIRPLRRKITDRFDERVERIFDYVMMPPMVAFAAGAMFKALNALSGLVVATPHEISVLRWVVWGMVIVRLGIEDLVLHLYPKRSEAVHQTRYSTPPRWLRGTAAAVRATLYVAIGAPFFGLGWALVLAAVLLSLPQVLKIFEDDLPNSATLNKWLPRGLLMFFCTLVIGALITATVVGGHPGPATVRTTLLIVLLPGVVLGVAELFGREGGSWNVRSWVKWEPGALVWLAAFGIVSGRLVLANWL